jgi:hypothetical protein
MVMGERLCPFGGGCDNNGKCGGRWNQMARTTGTVCEKAQMEFRKMFGSDVEVVGCGEKTAKAMRRNICLGLVSEELGVC